MKNFYKKNAKVKLIVLFSSFILWIYVMGVVDPIITRDITINDISFIYENSNNNMEFVPIDDVQTVRIQMKGKSSDITNQISNGIGVTGIISNPKIGENTVMLKTELPAKIHYEFIPKEFVVKLDTIAVQSRTIEIEVIDESTTAERVYSIENNITSTYVEGASSELKKVEKIIATVKLDNRKENFSEKLELYAVDKNGKRMNTVHLSDKYVFVKVSFNYSKEVDVVPNIVSYNGEKLRLSAYSTEPNTVLLTGDTKSLDMLTEVYTKQIPCNNILACIGNQIELNNVDGLSMEPSSVKITRIDENILQKEIKYDVSEIIFKNFSSEEIEKVKNILKESIIATVLYSKELDSEIDKSNVTIVLDKNNTDNVTKKVSFQLVTRLPIDSYKVNVNEIFLGN
ncbi:CdaR family protein [Filifactor alocis]|uniref:CdaR family protein n=1 Tax=Filifactor alocis TaxID=143361 RepID=UPI003C7015B5